jgi:hypothetical protein
MEIFQEVLEEMIAPAVKEVVNVMGNRHPKEVCRIIADYQIDKRWLPPTRFQASLSDDSDPLQFEHAKYNFSSRQLSLWSRAPTCTYLRKEFNGPNAHLGHVCREQLSQKQVTIWIRTKDHNIWHLLRCTRKCHVEAHHNNDDPSVVYVSASVE